MKNNFASMFGGLLLVTTTLMPVFAGAQVRPTSTEQASGGGFCNALSQRAASIQSQLSDEVNKMQGRKMDRKDNLEKKWGDYLNDLKNREDRQDKELSDDSYKLNQRAQTDVQKAAVVTFRAAMQAALANRKTAVDAALKAFHDGVALFLDTKKSSLENGLKAASDAIATAVAKAQTDCAKTGITATGMKAVRAAFMSAVQAAKSSFNSARKADDMSVEMKKLTAAKKLALDKAQDDFHAAVIAARDALKAVLGNSTSTRPTATSTEKGKGND